VDAEAGTVDHDDLVSRCIQAALDDGLVARYPDGRDTIHLTRKGLTVAPVLAALVEALVVNLQSKRLVPDKEYDQTQLGMICLQVLSNPQHSVMAMEFLGELG